MNSSLQNSSSNPTVHQDFLCHGNKICTILNSQNMSTGILQPLRMEWRKLLQHTHWVKWNIAQLNWPYESWQMTSNILLCNSTEIGVTQPWEKLRLWTPAQESIKCKCPQLEISRVPIRSGWGSHHRGVRMRGEHVGRKKYKS